MSPRGTKNLCIGSQGVRKNQCVKVIELPEATQHVNPLLCLGIPHCKNPDGGIYLLLQKPSPPPGGQGTAK